LEKVEAQNPSNPAPSTSKTFKIRKKGKTQPVQQEEKDQRSSPPTVTIENEVSPFPSSPKSYGTWAHPRIPPKKDPSADAIRVEKRRLAKRRWKIASMSNAGKRNRTPLQRRNTPVPVPVTPVEKGRCENVGNCMRIAWRKSVACAKEVKAKACNWFRKVLDKKREWDLWNPNKDHPVVRCIDETKLAGLKETIKPNRGILYRSGYFFTFI
jgi:hypothetical protein